jgi:protease-4
LNVQQKKSSSWKWFLGIFIGIVLIVIVFFAAALFYFAGSLKHTEKTFYYEVSGSGSGKVAIVELDYTIIDPESLVRQFKKYREDKSIKAIVLRINSPGGGVAASQEMYEEVKRTRDAGKPVVVSFGSIAASGGFYVACGGSYIVANPGSITGSIGVIAQFITIKELADKIGIKETTVKTGKFKDSGDPFRELNKDDLEYFQSVVNDSYEQFLEVVSKERKIPMEQLKEIADGRVFTGKQALELKLVDTLGTYQDAIMIAARLGKIEGEPAIVKEKVKRGILDLLLESISQNSLESIKNQLETEYINKPILQYKFEK